MLVRRVRCHLLVNLVVAALSGLDGIHTQLAIAQTVAAAPLTSLKTVPIPEPTNLHEFIKNRRAAIALGKALFWDMQVGSDGIQACASCHFHAGADSRSKNQLSPGLLQVDARWQPAPDTLFSWGGANHQLRVEDYPFRKLANPNDRHSTVLADTNDVASSQGVFHMLFSEIVPGDVRDAGMYEFDPIFHVGAVNVRRVEPRNTPSVINAVFNFRNFWDGRAQHDFNGVNPLGARDPNAKVLVVKARARGDEDEDDDDDDDGGLPLEQVHMQLNNASLASQAVEPPTSTTEMSFRDRAFRLLGRKLLALRPLNQQLVHPQDSVLGSESRWPRRGLHTTYRAMIQAAFQDKWWKSTTIIKVLTTRTIQDPDPDAAEADDDEIAVDTHGDLILEYIEPERNRVRSTNEFTLMEYNFALFFGLAIQMYEATLVSDDTPFDRFLAGDTRALTAQQQRGLRLFQDTNTVRCINCHGGTELTNASVRNVAPNHLFRRSGNVIDQGFNNIGVRPTWEDLGIGNVDSFGQPLSEARLAQQGLYTDPNLVPPLGPRESLGVDGAFKTPGLRNVELTAPYFHNGGFLTLRQVIDFYSRGGDFQPIVGREGPISPLHTLNLSEADREALVAFLQGLTDERVRYRRAPFDHPELFVPDGHPGDRHTVTDDGSGMATDVAPLLRIPPVGRFGGTPLPNFLTSP